MATVTGDLALNAFGQPDTNPVTLPAELTGFGDALRYFNNKLRVWDGGGFYSTAAPSLDTIVSKIEIGSDNGDTFGPAVINTSLNGLYVECRYDAIQMYTIVAGAQGTPGASASITLAPTDEAFLTFTNSTGAFDVSVNGVSQITGTDATYSDLRAGYIFIATDYADTGAYSWAADGYSAATSITPNTTTPLDGSLLTITPTGMTGTIISATIAGKDVLSALSSTDPTAPFDIQLEDISAGEVSSAGSRIGQLSTVSIETAADGVVSVDITTQPKTGWTVVDLAATLIKTTTDGVKSILLALDDDLGITTAIGNQLYYQTDKGESITAQGLGTYGTIVPYEFMEFVIQQGGSATTVATSYPGAFYPFGAGTLPPEVTGKTNTKLGIGPRIGL